MVEDDRENPEESPFEEPAGGEVQPDESPEEIDKEPGRPRDAAAEETPVLEDTPTEPLKPAELIRPEADLPGVRPREELGRAIAGEQAEEPAADPDQERTQRIDDWVPVERAGGGAAPDQPPAADQRAEEVPSGYTEADTEPEPLPVQRQWASPEQLEQPRTGPAPVSDAGGTPLPQSNAFGVVGDTLARVGITDRRTQQWVAAAVALVVLGCCACSCWFLAASVFSG
ncbi:MAG TPA: hypothetical protein VKY39_00470 [Aggregatilineales bacterium]|nr:hypothetical protein [Aggregatilineales bacterium]